MPSSNDSTAFSTERLLTLSVPHLTLLLSSLLAVCIGTTYLTCVGEHECQVFLPMISDTWVYPPGTYLSRLTLSMVAAGLGVVYSAFYYARVGAGSPARLQAALLSVTHFSCVTMGVVGAVCEDSKVPSCDVGPFAGIHNIAAILTFGIGTIYAVQAVCSLPRKAPRVGLSLLAVASLVSKARWLPGNLALTIDRNPAVPLLEWSDAAALIVFFPMYAAACCPDFSFGYLRSHGPLPFCQGPLPSLSGPAASTPSPLASWSEKGLVRIVQRMVAVTAWPTLCDMWVSPPSNIISRYMVCLGALLAAASQLSHLLLSNVARARTLRGFGLYLNALLHAISLAGLFGLAVVGACNVDEDFNLHSFAASAFFGLHLVYFVLDAIWSASSAKASTNAFAAAACLAAAASIGSHALAPHLVVQLSANGTAESFGAICEWFALLCFTVLLSTSTDAFDGLGSIHLALSGPGTPTPPARIQVDIKQQEALASALLLNEDGSGLLVDRCVAASC